MKANKDNRTPSHYVSSYQHWDLVHNTGMNYLEGASTKYITRWRKKNGIQDLEKALHYLDKIIETADFFSERKLNYEDIEVEVHLFAEANQLTEKEHQYIHLLCTYEACSDLYNARDCLLHLIQTAEIPPGTPENGGHHAKEEL